MEPVKFFIALVFVLLCFKVFVLDYKPPDKTEWSKNKLKDSDLED